ncbi:hypothetical protein [Streptacidiphilus sp. PAMC 29251]
MPLSMLSDSEAASMDPRELQDWLADLEDDPEVTDAYVAQARALVHRALVGPAA